MAIGINPAYVPTTPPEDVIRTWKTSQLISALAMYAAEPHDSGFEPRGHRAMMRTLCGAELDRRIPVPG